MNKIRIGIVGYGNIGRGVELAVERNEDMELVAVVTRREPKSVQILTEGVKKVHFDDILTLKGEVDVMILCGGSATDLPVMGPEIAKHFNMIDSFDTHAKIPEYFADVDTAANEGKKVGIISVGWDPGMFSLNRIYAESILVQGSTYTFWGKGVSQGHSDAIRRIEGVKNAIQYTVPIEEAVERVRSGSEPELSTREKHLRECYVVAEEGADKALNVLHRCVAGVFYGLSADIAFPFHLSIERSHRESNFPELVHRQFHDVGALHGTGIRTAAGDMAAFPAGTGAQDLFAEIPPSCCCHHCYCLGHHYSDR